MVAKLIKAYFYLIIKKRIKSNKPQNTMDKKAVSKKIKKVAAEAAQISEKAGTPAAKANAKKSNVRKIKDFTKHILESQKSKGQTQKQISGSVKFNQKQLKAAIAALVEYNSGTKQKNQLLDSEDGFLYLDVTVNKLPDEHSIRPVQMYPFHLSTNLKFPIENCQCQFTVTIFPPERAFSVKTPKEPTRIKSKIRSCQQFPRYNKKNSKTL
jgi:small-conductance mechanosensitive channel